MATATERRFTSLRKRLDQLGYRQPLGVESLPLVEKLFGDLLHTTESLKSSKQQLGKQKEQKVSVHLRLSIVNCTSFNLLKLITSYIGYHNLLPAINLPKPLHIKLLMTLHT